MKFQSECYKLSLRGCVNKIKASSEPTNQDYTVPGMLRLSKMQDMQGLTEKTIHNCLEQQAGLLKLFQITAILKFSTGTQFYRSQLPHKSDHQFDFSCIHWEQVQLYNQYLLMNAMHCVC